MKNLSKNNGIVLTWIPSDFGTHGQERADKTKIKGFLADIFNTKILDTDLKLIIHKFIIDKWQTSWDDQIHKLHRKQNTIGEWPVGYRKKKEKKKQYSLDFTLAITTWSIHTC